MICLMSGTLLGHHREVDMNFKEHLRRELNENLLRALMKGSMNLFDYADDFIPPGGFNSPLRKKARELDATNLDDLIPPVGTFGEVIARLREIKKPDWFTGSDQAWSNLIGELVRDLPIMGIEPNHPMLQMISQMMNWMTSGGSINNLLQLLQQGHFGQFFTTSMPGNLFHMFQNADGVYEFGLNPSVTGGLSLDDYFSLNNISPDDQVTINGLNSIFEFLNNLGLT